VKLIGMELVMMNSDTEREVQRVIQNNKKLKGGFIVCGYLRSSDGA
jgi:hypothetical protein